MGGFHFIGNVLDVQIDLPATISDALRIERADDNQVQEIRNFLRTVTAFSSPTSLYERDWRRIQLEGDASRDESTPLERADWRYYILTFSDNGLAAYNLQLAANIVSPSLTFYACQHVRTIWERRKDRLGS